MIRRRALRVRQTQGALVLLYHRIAKPESDPWLLSVSPSHFEEQLEVLRKVSEPVALRQLSDASRESRRPAAAVTFDDGYADNLHTAKPLLERFGIPATVFVTSGQLGSKRQFWWDELDRVLLAPTDLPPTLELELGGTRQRFDLRGTPARRSAYLAVYERLQTATHAERESVLIRLADWAGAGRLGLETRRALTAEELLRLADDGTVEIGAHTRTHPILARLPPAIQREEIEGSKADLERLLGRPVASFAYPHGQEQHFTGESVRIVRQAGFGRACTSIPGTVGRDTDVFRLPRVMVEDWDGDRFATMLRMWLAEGPLVTGEDS